MLTTYFVFRILYFYFYLYLFSRTQIKFVFTSMCISCKHQSFLWENNTEFYWFSQCVSTWYHLWVSYLSIISLFGGRRGGDGQVKVWTDDCVNSVWYNLVLTMIKILSCWQGIFGGCYQYQMTDLGLETSISMISIMLFQTLPKYLKSDLPRCPLPEKSFISEQVNSVEHCALIVDSSLFLG